MKRISATLATIALTILFCTPAFAGASPNASRAICTHTSTYTVTKEYHSTGSGTCSVLIFQQKWCDRCTTLVDQWIVDKYTHVH